MSECVQSEVVSDFLPSPIAGFIPTTAFQVLYDFESTNEKELTISSGEILLSQGNQYTKLPQTLTLLDIPDKDEDWIFVVKINNAQERGFVPSGMYSTCLVLF